MNQRDTRLPIPDVQGSPDTRQLAIDRVGFVPIVGLLLLHWVVETRGQKMPD